MTQQPELDLPSPTSSAPGAVAPRRRTIFAGFTRTQLLTGALAIGVLVWGMWVTKSLISSPEEHIVSARLSAIVGEYVQAQAHSAAPPERVEAEMRRFMALLDEELQRRSRKGEIVIVGEAVLSRNVPDITDSLKKAVYASGITLPDKASAREILLLGEQALRAPAPPASENPFGAAPASFDQPPMIPNAYPGASASTFGGPNGTGPQ